LIIKGREFSFLVFALLVVMTIYLMRRGKQSWSVRKIAGLDAIEESIGRATEMGRPVFFTPGGGDVVSGASAVDTMAAVEVLSYVASMTAKYKLKLTVGIRQANTYAVADQTVKEAYVAAGQPDLYSPDIVQFYSPEQFAYAASCVGYFQRERPSAILMLGWFQAEAVMLAEGAAQTGAITVGGMVKFNQLAMMVACCDYILIGEELYVAGAYLSQNKIKLACIRSQDFGKLAAIVAIIVGTLMVSAGNKALVKLFS